MNSEYKPRLLQYLKELDSSISNIKDSLPRISDTMQVYGLIEIMSTYQCVKGKFLSLFPELKEHYEKTLENKLQGASQ